MKREFNIGDTAHLSKGKRVRGILNYNEDNETYKDFTLRWKDEVKILGFDKADDKTCGGWVYDCEVIYKNMLYRVECISQFDLVSKNLWEKSLEQDRIITELMSQNK